MDHRSHKGSEGFSDLRFVRSLICFPVVLAAALAVPAAHAQISFSSAIDLALRNSPKVKMAEADVAKSTAVLSESRDVFIPSLSAGSGLGYSYGFPVGQPTLYSFTVQSLVFDQSQKNYIRAARMGLEAANYALADARQAVAEDTALTYLALDHDLQRLDGLQQQLTFASRLTEITQARLDANQDSRIDFTKSRLTAAQVRLARLHTESDTNFQRQHLANLTGLPAEGLSTIHDSIPQPPAPVADTPAVTNIPAIQAAYASAQSKFQVAFGDSRKMYRPQIAFAAQYNRYAEFNNYQDYYRNFQRNNFSFGIQLNWPIFNANLRAKARESVADAVRAQYDADRVKKEFLEGRAKAVNALPELAVRTEIATLDRDLAQQQLEAVQIQLSQGSGNPNAPQPTPKDEQNAHIQERQKFLDMLDADLALRQTQISALRVTGQLEQWLKSSVRLDNTLPQAPSAATLKP